MAEALGPVLDDEEFDGVSALLPTAIHIGGEYYAVTYKKSTYSHWLKTYRIIANGTISEIDTWEFTTENAEDHLIKNISGTLYVITYHWFDGTNNLGRLKTLHISSTGVITKSFDDTYNITRQEYFGFLFQITGAYYVLITGDSPVNHYVYTFTIITGAAGITLVDSYQYINLGYHVEAAGKVSNNVYFAVFGCDTYYKVVTFHVSNTGVITTPYTASQDFTVACGHGFLRSVKITSNIFAISGFTTAPNEGFIQTVQINNNGTIEGTLLDDYPFTGVTSLRLFLCYTGSGNRYYAVYRGVGDDGFIDIFEINISGEISDDPLYSAFEFDIAYCDWPWALPTNGDFMPVFYIGPDGDGWMKSITFTPPPSGAHHEMTMKIGP